MSNVSWMGSLVVNFNRCTVFFVPSLSFVHDSSLFRVLFYFLYSPSLRAMKTLILSLFYGMDHVVLSLEQSRRSFN